MSTQKKPKPTEDVQAALQGLIAQGHKEGMIRTSDLNSVLEKMDLSPEKIEEIYDRFEAMNIQVVSAELDLDLDDAGIDGDIGSQSGIHRGAAGVDLLGKPVELASIGDFIVAAAVDRRLVASVIPEAVGVAYGIGDIHPNADHRAQQCSCEKSAHVPFFTHFVMIPFLYNGTWRAVCWSW